MGSILRGPEVSVEGVSHTYGALPVLDEINIAIESGTFAAIVGPSGCGKSTLLRMIAGLELPHSGRVHVNGTKVSGPGPDKMLVFQKHSLYPWRTVMDNIAFGLELHGRRTSDGEAINQVISLVGLAGFEDYYPHQLSGGMQQRVSLARALVMQPTLLLLDEPFGALDALTKLTLQQEMRTIFEQRPTTVILVTHDVDEAVYLADTVLVFSPRPGRIVKSVSIPLSADRSRTSTQFSYYKSEILDALGLDRREIS